MVSQPGRLQVGFTAGVLDPGLHDNTELKYFGRGVKTGRNIECEATGGFHQADGLRRIGAVAADARRGFGFTASDGSVFDAVASLDLMAMWDVSAQAASVTTPYSVGQLPDLTWTQLLDTAIFFHVDVAPQRLVYTGGSAFSWAPAPIGGLSNYDYGGVYVNGVAAQWTLQFSGLTDASTVFVLTVSRQETQSIVWSSTIATLKSRIDAALALLPNLKAGYTVTNSGSDVIITFSGTGNGGDGWAVSGAVVNKADAAVLAFHTTIGVLAGEAIISNTRGWPRCGTFYLQRLLMGGLKALPNTWLMSIEGDFYNFDTRLSEANGAAVVPMDIPGGESIEAMSAQRNLLIFTNKREYWLKERTLSKTVPPVHVEAAANGIKRATAVSSNEAAAVFIYSNGGVVGELRYTDIDGNFTTQGISILSSHLIVNVVAAALRKASSATDDGALFACVLADGSALIAKLLREQDVTAFTQRTTDGKFLDVWVNGRNELSFLVERTSSNGTVRTLERFEPGLLFDGATTRTLGVASATVSGLGHHEGRAVWCEGDGDIFGPFTVSGGSITLPKAVLQATVGRWSAPYVETLPPPRTVARSDNAPIVVRRKGRIHSMWVSVEDATSLAVGANGVAAKEVPLRRLNEVAAGTPELSAGVTGQVVVRGLRVPNTGAPVEPTAVVTQLRPGKLAVRSLTVEARL
jgi:hypothetical protein